MIAGGLQSDPIFSHEGMVGVTIPTFRGFPAALRGWPTSFLHGTRRYIDQDRVRSSSETQLGFIRPELPILVSETPTGEGWINEIKYDGYRTLIVIDRGQVRLHPQW